MPFKNRSKYIIGTEFNFNDPEEYLLNLSKCCDYIVGQVEKCPTTGKAHIQFSAYNKKSIGWTFIKCTKTYHQYGDPLIMLDYSKKAETRIEGPWEFGVRPKEGGRPKLTCKEILEKPLKELIEENLIRPDQIIKIQQNKQVYSILNATYSIEDRYVKRGKWLVGKPRTGKSTLARKNQPYIKMPNKWWDGYLGQKEVLLEDVEPSMRQWLGYYLKIWTDWWSFRAEIKGSSYEIGPFDTFWVTSNYLPEEVFDAKDIELIDALYKRFDIINM